MKLFKLISIIVLSILLIASITLNIIFFKSSYASLMIIYNKDMFYSLADNATKDFYPTSFLQSKNKGLELTIDFEDSKDYISYYFYVDEESKLSFKIVETKNGKSVTRYLSNDIVYINDEVNNTKTKTSITIKDEFYSIAVATTKIDKLLPYIQNNNKEKTEIDFELPYILGVEYEVEINNSSSYTYHFDLKGNLRSVDVDIENSKEYTVTIKENNKKINLPDFSDYTAE